MQYSVSLLRHTGLASVENRLTSAALQHSDLPVRVHYSSELEDSNFGEIPVRPYPGLFVGDAGFQFINHYVHVTYIHL